MTGVDAGSLVPGDLMLSEQKALFLIMSAFYILLPFSSDLDAKYAWESCSWATILF